MSDVAVEKIEQTPGSTEDQGDPKNITASGIVSAHLTPEAQGEYHSNDTDDPQANA